MATRCYKSHTHTNWNLINSNCLIYLNCGFNKSITQWFFGCLRSKNISDIGHQRSPQRNIGKSWDEFWPLDSCWRAQWGPHESSPSYWDDSVTPWGEPWWNPTLVGWHPENFTAKLKRFPPVEFLLELNSSGRKVPPGSWALQEWSQPQESASCSLWGLGNSTTG